MREIDVVASPSAQGWECSVEVVDAGSRSRHRVAVSRDELARYGRAGEDAASLVRRSMAFLLEREPAGSILGSFDLSIIERYFPEYPSVIAGG